MNILDSLYCFTPMNMSQFTSMENFKVLKAKAEIIFKEGKFLEIKIKKVKGKKPLDSKNLKKLETVVEKYRDDIVSKWVDFFVYNKNIEVREIRKKIS